MQLMPMRDTLQVKPGALESWLRLRPHCRTSRTAGSMHKDSGSLSALCIGKCSLNHSKCASFVQRWVRNSGHNC